MATARPQRAPSTRRLPLASIPLLALVCSGPAAADAVIDWNTTFTNAAPAVGGGPQQAYLGAMVHLAVHDALNSIQPRYERYSVVPPANPSASPNAAIAAAARGVLINQLSRPPESDAKIAARANVRAHYAAALAGIPDGQAENLGIAAGKAAAAAIIALRAGDGSDTPNLPYPYAPARGVYQPTPPALAPPALAGWALVKPFVLQSAAQFRAPPARIFFLKGEDYARAYNEVKQVGDARVRGAAPDSERSRIARFWPGGGANWSSSARIIVAGLHLDRWQHARLFALLETAQADAAISVFDTKYTYNFWRPVTAIRWLNDGNPHTKPDPEWLPYLATPPYPDYTCGLPTLTGAATEALRRFFGTDAVPFTKTVTIPQLPPAAPDVITRSYHHLSQAANEAAMARVYAGIHFREGCKTGVRLGSQVGAFVYRNALQPLKPAKQRGAG